MKGVIVSLGVAIYLFHLLAAMLAARRSTIMPAGEARLWASVASDCDVTCQTQSVDCRAY